MLFLFHCFQKVRLIWTFSFFKQMNRLGVYFFYYYVFKEPGSLKFSAFSNSLFYSEFFYLLFGYHPKSNKKVTAAVKFAKIVTLRAKKLNIAIKSQWYEWVQPFLIIFPRFKFSCGNCQFFLTPSTSRFFNAISRMRFSLVESALVLFSLFSRFSLFQMLHNGQSYAQ
jgi:hypothetical protein